MPEIPVSSSVVSTIADQLQVSAAQVEQVLATWNAVLAGDPPGTVRRSADGQVAHRVVQDGMHLWVVTDGAGGMWQNTSPSLGWPAIYTPSEA